MESEEGSVRGSRGGARLTATRRGEYHPRTLYASAVASDVHRDDHEGRVPYDRYFEARKAPATPR